MEVVHMPENQEPQTLSPQREKADAISGAVLFGIVAFAIVANVFTGNNEAMSCTPDKAGAIARAQSAVGETIDSEHEIEIAGSILQSEIDRCR